MTLTMDLWSNFDSHILGMGGLVDLEWKRCELDTMLDAHWAFSWATVHGKYIGQVIGQIETVSFQPVGPWMGSPFTDLGTEGCCSLNALFKFEVSIICSCGWSSWNSNEEIAQLFPYL